MSACELVLVEWVDSRQPTSSWAFLKDAAEMPACKCCSVGFLIRDDAKVKVLAPNVADIDSDMQATGVITIPTAAVTAMKRLQETTSSSRPFASKRKRRPS